MDSNFVLLIQTNTTTCQKVDFPPNSMYLGLAAPGLEIPGKGEKPGRAGA